MPPSIFDFVKTRKQRWERLSQLCDRVEKEGLARLSVENLWELGSLYRQAASDLAYVQSYFPHSDLLEILNGLVARAHGFVYRTRSSARLGSLLDAALAAGPRAFRRNLAYFRVSAGVFALAVLFGATACLADEKLASLFIGERILESIHRGEMWTGPLFQIIPMSVASLAIFLKNLMVVLFVFGGGIAWGLGTLFSLTMNGLLLGSVIAMCLRYGLALRLFDFVAAHGILELSVVLVCGGAGLMLGQAVLAPGRYTRRELLRRRGPEAVTLVVVGGFFLALAGLVEGVISPVHSLPQNTGPTQIKALFGLLLGILFYSYLLLYGREERA